jgi:methylmalonyl-CoA epimerase
MLQKIDHIGIAVKSIAAARKFYEDVLGLTCEKEEEIASQKVKVALYLLGDVYLELLEPTDPTSPVAGFIEKKGEGFHHIAYKTDGIEAQLETADKHGCRLIHKVPFIGAGGKQVAFLHPQASFGVLTEFCAQTDE